MCNDNTDTVTRDCGDLASYVLDIIGDLDCIMLWSGSNALIQGQEFDTDGFNIIAGGGGCSENTDLVWFSFNTNTEFTSLNRSYLGIL